MSFSAIHGQKPDMIFWRADSRADYLANAKTLFLDYTLQLPQGSSET